MIEDATTKPLTTLSMSKYFLEETENNLVTLTKNLHEYEGGKNSKRKILIKQEDKVQRFKSLMVI